MKNNKKAFTLVELIVVITILAILGAIGFLSIQGYGKEARNTKRQTDISNIANLILTKSAEGTSPLVLIGGSDENKISLTFLKVGGKIATNDTYDAGLPNYLALGIKKENFLDPKGDDYRIGATSTYGGRFEIAATLEVDNNHQTYIGGTYISREKEVFTVESISSNVVTLGLDATNKFKRADSVLSNTGSGFIIKRVGPDNISLSFDSDMTGVTSIELALSETKGLIADKDDPTIILINGSETSFPY